MEIRKRFYYKKNADGSRTKVYYYPVTHESAIVSPEGKGLSKNDYTNEDKAEVQKIASLSLNQGTLGNLTTTAKTNLVSAINEVKTATDSKANSSDLTSKLQVDEVKTNGNIVLKDGSGNKKEYMAATPSGDPMHYLYINQGATYNEATGYWELNTLTDITNDEMKDIYISSIGFKPHSSINADAFFAGKNIRTNMISGLNLSAENKTSTTAYTHYGVSAKTTRFYSTFNSCKNIEVAFINPDMIAYSNNLNYIRSADARTMFDFCWKLKKIVGAIYLSGTAIQTMFNQCYLLEEVRLLGLFASISIKDSPNISVDSIAFMINYCNTSKTGIVITLHADAYARAMADSDVQAALQAHTNVSLIPAT